MIKLFRRSKPAPEPGEPPMSLREQLRRANPTVSGPTVDVLRGKIPPEEYRRQIRELDRRSRKPTK
jgi:hypothetical protein